MAPLSTILTVITAITFIDTSLLVVDAICATAEGGITICLVLIEFYGPTVIYGAAFVCSDLGSVCRL